MVAIPVLSAVVVVCVLFKAPSSYSNTQPLKIVVDPGHGGADTGAVRSSLKESELVLAVAFKLKQFLQKDVRFQLTLTRSNNDRSLSLKDRVQIAESVGAELFISLHANTEFTQKARGIEIYFQSPIGSDEDAQYLASIENRSLQRKDLTLQANIKKTEVESILEDLKKTSSIKSSHKFSQKLAQLWSTSSEAPVSIRQAPFYVISRNKMPSILIELGFLSNAKEAQKLSSESYQEKIALQIYQGLLQYKEMIDNFRSSSL